MPLALIIICSVLHSLRWMWNDLLNVTVVLSALNHWPAGTYSIPKPKGGCPLPASQWTTGNEIIVHVFQVCVCFNDCSTGEFYWLFCSIWFQRRTFWDNWHRYFLLSSNQQSAEGNNVYYVICHQKLITVLLLKSNILWKLFWLKM